LSAKRRSNLPPCLSAGVAPSAGSAGVSAAGVSVVAGLVFGFVVFGFG
jgi:hypothetical protein